MILVTGGAGYIGSHCVRELLAQGFDVAVVDNLATGHRSAIDPRARFFEGDIRDKAFLDGVFAEIKPEAVIHFAAFSLVGVSMQQPLAYYNNNVHGSEVRLTSMIENGITKIVFSSTAATYGEATCEQITEDCPTVPTNTYGETKLAIEKMMKWCDRAFGLKFTALRYFNVAGADGSGEIGEDHSPETHLIPIILQVAAGEREKLLWENAKSFRSSATTTTPPTAPASATISTFPTSPARTFWRSSVCSPAAKAIFSTSAAAAASPFWKC